MDQPSAAPDQALDDQPQDDARNPVAADVLRDDDATPGGGTLRPQDAPPQRAAGGTAPNAPIDTQVAPGVSARDDAAERESIESAGERAPEPRPTSA